MRPSIFLGVACFLSGGAAGYALRSPATPRPALAPNAPALPGQVPAPNASVPPEPSISDLQMKANESGMGWQNEMIRTARPEIRARVADLIQRSHWCGDPSDVRFLISLYKDDPDPEVRNSALAALATASLFREVDEIYEAAFRDPDPRERVMAAYRWQREHPDDPRVMEVFEALHAHPDEGIRLRVASFLGSERHSDRDLLRKMQETDPSSKVRAVAAKNLAALEKEIATGKTRVQIEGENALRLIEARHVPQRPKESMLSLSDFPWERYVPPSPKDAAP